MSTSIEMHDVTYVEIGDLVRSGTTTWRAVKVTDKDGKTIEFTFYAPHGRNTINLTIGGEDE